MEVPVVLEDAHQESAVDFELTAFRQESEVEDRFDDVDGLAVFRPLVFWVVLIRCRWEK